MLKTLLKGRKVIVNSKLTKLKNLLIYRISQLGLSLSSTKTLNSYQSAERAAKRYSHFLRFIETYGCDFGKPLNQFFALAKSQIEQDLWVATASQFEMGGSFLEIGGADGVKFSNTYALEKLLSWRGVIIEPARVWHEQLRINRSCIIDIRCCASRSGEKLDFLETPEALLSTIETSRYNDGHAHEREKGKCYPVETVSLNDIFAQYFPDNYVDYLSIDTEGNEDEILSAFDFERFRFRFATIENAFNNAKRDRIHSLMIDNGYKRVFEDLSQFDDYYEKT